MVRQMTGAAQPLHRPGVLVEIEQSVGAPGRAAAEVGADARLVPGVPRAAFGELEPFVLAEEAVDQRAEEQLSGAAAAPTGDEAG